MPKVKFVFAWYDFWVGLFWDSGKRRLYVFPIPCVGVMLEWSRLPACASNGKHDWREVGGRPCPGDVMNCSQPVYQCAICGQYDYGNLNIECSECEKKEKP